MRLDHLLSKESEVSVLCVLYNHYLKIVIAQDIFRQARKNERRVRSVLKYVTNDERSSDAEWRKKDKQYGGLAQLGEHLLCTQGVKSSNLLISTRRRNP